MSPETVVPRHDISSAATVGGQIMESTFVARPCGRAQAAVTALFAIEAQGAGTEQLLLMNRYHVAELGDARAMMRAGTPV